MFVLFLLVLLNAVAAQAGWVRSLVFSIGPVTVNAYLLSLTLALAWALFLPGRTPWELAPEERRHPALVPMYCLFAIGFVVGLIGMVFNGSNLEMKEVGIAVRDFMLFPVTVFLGYRLIASPKSATTFAWIIIVAGIASSLLLILKFGSRAQEIGLTGNLNLERDNAYVTNYAGLACAVLLFSFLRPEYALMPRWLAIFLAGFCLLGQFAPLNRSDWLACMAGLLSLLLLVPKGERLRKFLVGTIGLGVLGVVAWLGVNLASNAMHRNFAPMVSRRVESMLPGQYGWDHQKAWDTRVPSILHDGEVILTNPAFGGGFGIQEKMAVRGGISLGEFHHNAWTDYWAKTGVAGFAAVLVLIGSMIVVGRRMVSDGHGNGFALVGALGLAGGAYGLVLGLGTMSLNYLRGEIVFGVLCGVVLRCRAMQTTTIQVSMTGSPVDGEADHLGQATYLPEAYS